MTCNDPAKERSARDEQMTFWHEEPFGAVARDARRFLRRIGDLRMPARPAEISHLLHAAS